MTLRRWSYRVGNAPLNKPGPSRRRVALRRMVLPTSLLLTGLVLLWITGEVDSASDSRYPVVSSAAYHPRLVALGPQLDRIDPETEGIPVEFEFESGQTVSDVLTSLNLAAPEMQLVIEELAKHADLRRIRTRDRYAAVYDEQTGLRSFELMVDGKGRAAVWRQDQGWSGAWRPFARKVAVNSLSGSLEESLESAIRNAGGEAAVAYLMADVLQWDLDFTRDLRTGDRFEVLYETVFLDGGYHSLGEIVALSYESRGQRLEAYRYGESDTRGYYDADGRPLRKMFLRSPMRYSRVTSRFSGRRFHPVLKRYRPHYGVDYGAPSGTPVRVTGNGVVASAGWNGGGGRTVKVRHPNGYLTAYLHLSKYASGVRSGKRVRQGDVIGYVGSSGLATGPHLDYRVQRDGRWIDPLSLKSVPADPVTRDDMPEFVAERDRLRRSLWEGAPYEIPAPSPTGEFTLAEATPDAVSGG